MKGGAVCKEQGAKPPPRLAACRWLSWPAHVGKQAQVGGGEKGSKGLAGGEVEDIWKRAAAGPVG